MALTGTIEDFGIAEILQLIGQQAKSGVLHLEHRDEEVHVAMTQGRVVSAEHARRRRRDRIGAMLLRAGLLSQDDLDRALQEQARSLRRLGDVLVELGLVSRDDLRQMTALQTAETLYGLFTWRRGTYRFEPGPVEWDPGTAVPVSAESILMEGFRQLDEWPMVRRRIPSPDVTFLRVRDVDGVAEGSARAAADDGEVGEAERRVYALAEPGRTVERIVDLSRLGQFATWKALFTLVNRGALEIAPRPRRRAMSRGASDGWHRAAGRVVVALGATCLLAGVVAAVAWSAADRAGAAPSAATSPAPAALRLVAAGQLSRLSGALETWQLEHGGYPDRLRLLVDAGLIAPSDLRYPYPEEYYYRRRAEGGYVLLPPLP